MNKELTLLVLLGAAAFLYMRKREEERGEVSAERQAAIARATEQTTPIPPETTVKVSTATKVGSAVGGLGAGVVCAIYATPATSLCVAGGSMVGGAVADPIYKGVKGLF